MRTYRVIIIALFALLRMGDAYAEAEPKEITIHIRGEYNKAVVSALLAAADAKTTRTGVSLLKPAASPLLYPPPSTAASPLLPNFAFDPALRERLETERTMRCALFC